MSYIKNRHVKHFVRNGRYLCNGAVEPTPEKSVRLKKQVKCRNCKIILKKEARDGSKKRKS